MSRDQQHASSTRHQDNSNAQTFVCNHHNNSHSATSSLFNITHVSLAAHVPFPQKFICTRPGEDPEFTLSVASADEPRDVAYADKPRVEDPVEDPT